MREKINRKRRKFLKVSIGAGALVLVGYYYWQHFLSDGVVEKQDKIQVKKQPKTPKTEGEKEMETEIKDYPSKSPLGHSYPYLLVEPVSGVSRVYGQEVDIKVQLNNQNLGGGYSSAVLEAFEVKSFSFPLSLSSLPILSLTPLHLSPGSSVTTTLDFTIPSTAVGILFVLSDPMFDPCPRSFNSIEEMKVKQRHFAYFGR